MYKIVLTSLLIFLLPQTIYSQEKPQSVDDQLIRISTELIQIDAVVVDKTGRIVKGLNKNDFELYDGGKKQQISFFEFVEAGKEKRSRDERPSAIVSNAPDVRRTLAFVIDDLTIQREDLIYIRQMLTNFLDTHMQPSDLVAIIRTIGGRGIYQQFTSDRGLLRQAIASLGPRTHPLNIASRTESGAPIGAPQLSGGPGPEATRGVLELSGDLSDISNPADDTNMVLRAFMSLGTASFVVDTMKQLPGRKLLVLVSGGLPILNTQGAAAGGLSSFLSSLSDRATRAGVAIHTLDVRGLQPMSGVTSFEFTPARSGLASSASDLVRQPPSMTNPTGNARATFGRAPDEEMLGTKNPFDAMEAHMGLRMLASLTGGIAVLNKNDFNQGLEKIIATSDGYYLLAYTPADVKFDGSFRKVDVKVKADGVRVYSRRGYMAREEKVMAESADKREQLLAAIKSPLARRDVEVDSTLVYKAASRGEGAIDIHLVIDPGKLRFEQADGKQESSFDVAGFVFDQFGKLRGGFHETITASLTREDLDRAAAGGLSYSASTTLPSGAYQIRLAVYDNKTGSIGTLSRYLEVPDLSKDRLAASSLMLSAVAPGDTGSALAVPIAASRRISRKQDLRYAVVIYNAKQKDGRPQVRTRLVISQAGKVLFQEPEETIAAGGKSQQLIKVGQLGLASVKPGRYTMQLVITDPLADKKYQTITRGMDFVVID